MALSEERRKQILRKRRWQNFLFYTVFSVLCLLLLAGLFFGVRGIVRLCSGPEKPTPSQSPAPTSAEGVLLNAKKLAAGYDYTQAISLIESFPGYESNEALSLERTKLLEEKSTLVPANIGEVTHVFFHTLIVDESKAFDGDYKETGYNQYMTTVDEFRAMLTIFYEKGFVLVNMDQMAAPETQADGTVKMVPREILLPPGKKPMVISQDDVSYYQYMVGDGFASRIVIGEDGLPTCEYIQDDGTVVTGEYDLVPILERFILEHPDFSYQGARATLAITGYDGVLGYRTCPSGEGYRAEDIPLAKAVADRMKELGWVFASHSWGHKLYGSASAEAVRTDAQKWEDEVQPILGETNIIIYAHGEDIGGVGNYTAENEKYNILREMGFRYFCNVDSNVHWVQLTDDYMRQGRRNLDGYRMYHNPELLTDLFDVNAVWSWSRPTPVPAI